MIKIYTMCTDEIDLSDDNLYKQMSLRRIEKINALKKELSKKQSAAAELLINKAVKTEYPGAELPLDIKESSGGKPYPADYKGLFLNVAHSLRYAMCAAADMPVGADIQYMRDISGGMPERFFTAAETDYVRNSPNPKSAFYELWVRKESFVKAVGEGLRIALNSFSVLDKTIEYGGSVYEIIPCDAADGYKMCVCVKRHNV